MHLLVIRSSETSYYLATVLVIRAWSDWKLLSWEVLRMHHKMMSVAIHGSSTFFGSFDHGRQLNHLTANYTAIRYGIANLAVSTTGVILRQIPDMARSFDNNLASIKRLSNPRAILRK
jgi:hypothetical protein